MKPRPGVVLLAVLVGACAGGADPWATPTPTSTLPAATTAPGTGSLPAEPGVDAASLAAIVLFPEDLPAGYAHLPLDPAGSGFRPAGASLSSALDPADEAEDIVRFGLLGDYVVTYGSTSDLWIAVEAVAFADPAGAGGYLADWQQDLAGATAGSEPRASELVSFTAAPDETAADEAVRASYSIAGEDPDEPGLAGSVRVARAGNILAWAWAAGGDPGLVIDLLGPLVEQRLLAVLGGALPARDPAGLGLPQAPTALLGSFAFAYSYGVETTASAGGFRIEVTGEFQAPDRASCRTAYTAGDGQPGVSHLVAIGTRVWLEGASGYQEVPLRHPSALTDLPLCPGHPLFWEDTAYHRLPQTPGSPDTLDGLAVIRTDLAGDPALLESLGYPPERAARITRYSVARAADGGWVAEIDLEERADLAAARRAFGLSAPPEWAGVPATIFTRLRLSRPNDPSIEVAPPLAAS